MSPRLEFLSALQPYTFNTQSEAWWKEMEMQYSEKGRHYHTLKHLNQLLAELEPVKEKFSNWPTIVLAIAWHDVVYNVLKQNNEEKSAEWAEERLKQTSFPQEQIKRCVQLIIATKKHEPADEETNLFTDADLCILGAEPEVYHQYTQQIRKEYSLYPDLIYKPGRIKALRHFQSMPQIFKTDVFYQKYEAQARINLQEELKNLR